MVGSSVEHDHRNAFSLSREDSIPFSGLIFLFEQDLYHEQTSRTTARELQFASVVNLMGKTLLKFLNFHLVKFAKKKTRDLRCPFPVSLWWSMRRWLQPHVLSAVILFRHPPPSMDVFTDTSPNRGEYILQTIKSYKERGQVSWQPATSTF